MPKDFVRRFMNAADADMRLRGVFRYDGKACYLERYRGDAQFKYIVCFLDGSKSVTIDVNNDKQLDLSSCPLGYVNREGFAQYVYRMQARVQRQGITPENTVSRYPFQQEDQIGHVRNELLYSVEFAKMVVNDYPSFDKALEEVLALRAFSVAFSRTKALARNEVGLVILFHKTRPLGVVSTEERMIIVPGDQPITSNFSLLLDNIEYGVRYADPVE